MATSWQPPFGPGIDGSGESRSEIGRAMLAGRPSGLDALKGPWHSRSRDYEQAEYALDPAAYGRLNDYEERERSLPYRIVHVTGASPTTRSPGRACRGAARPGCSSSRPPT